MTQVFWSEEIDQLLTSLDTGISGLTSDQAKARLLSYGPNRLKPKKRTDSLSLLLRQFKSPIILILLFSATLALLASDNIDGLIIIIIVLLSSTLGFWQERTTTNAIEQLMSIIRIYVSVLRDGAQVEIALDDITPGDIIVLNAGDIVPGDCRIIESEDLFINEATLTGETFASEKKSGTLPAETPLSKRANSLFMGTSVVSGNATAVVVLTGIETEFGRISERLKIRPPSTEFEQGISRFGYLLMELTFIFVVVIFLFNVYFSRPVLDSFMFALALAVGITPQLLPAVISVNLAQGARKMAKGQVIVKRLNSIENFGTMDLLCSDKTGTVTEGRVVVHSAVDTNQNPSEQVLLYASLNAHFQSGYTNPIDVAISATIDSSSLQISNYSKIDEVPYDFIRKRLSVLVHDGFENVMITKGAVQNILSVCTNAEIASDKIVQIDNETSLAILDAYRKFSAQGYRTLGVAYRKFGNKETIDRTQEADMTFLGLIVLYDPLKEGVDDVLAELRRRKINFKMITGDNVFVAGSLAKEIGLDSQKILTGPSIRLISDEALMVQATEIDIFAEVEPNQKERIILALRKAGHVVGYIGDGINDASALHAADVGISVEGAVDVAKEAADIILLEKDLRVLVGGIDAGRKTFANTMKYIFVTMSGNFGNMISMAIASLILPFLPLLPTQILSINLLTDFPGTTISTDEVDPELIDSPKRWNIKFIAKFMAAFGLQSTLFDLITFAALLLFLQVTESVFQTGWFLVSVVTELLIMLVIRTRKLFYKSRPSKQLLGSTFAILFVALVLPYSPIALVLGFSPLPMIILGGLLVIVIFYILTTELVKHFFYKHVDF